MKQEPTNNVARAGNTKIEELSNRAVRNGQPRNSHEEESKVIMVRRNKDRYKEKFK